MQWDIMQRAFGDAEHDARPDRRPQAGHLCVPRRRRAGLSAGEGRGLAPSGLSTSTGAATRRCSTPSTPCSATPSSVRAGSTYRTVRAAAGQRDAAARRCARDDSPAGPHRARRRRSRGPDEGTGAQGGRVTGPHRHRPGRQVVELLTAGGGSSPGTATAPKRGPDDAAPRAHRRAGALQRPRGGGARRAARGGRPRRHRRRRLRLRLRCRRADWLRLLEALERPTARDRASLTALTRFVGWTAEEVALVGRGAMGGAPPVAAPVGRVAARPGRRRRCTRRSVPSAASPSASWRAPTGSAS